MDGENLEKTTDTDTNEEIEDDEVIEPVGTDNLSSLEKRISELENTIKEYESLEKRISKLEDKTEEYESLKDNLSNLEETIGSGSSDPVIYFMEFEDTDYTWVKGGGNCVQQFYCTNLYEGDNFVFCQTDGVAEVCRLSIGTDDTDGWIEMISYETTTGNQSVHSGCPQDWFRVVPNNAVGCIHPYLTFGIPYDLCGLDPVNQTLTFRAYDNDGNSAEIEYYLDYDAVCNASFGR